ncbi:hypothetical protein DEO72_LG5g1821 [Vigna unguiculata]|uniref:Uncharacterized protein n=1 Tax=Vigna unguiculata TaxID=3917 RepID=A0A4D6LYB9_VIGUN|nr:hypothetical protein DEO72_LG5g1821 [Vigna unguiculata]
MKPKKRETTAVREHHLRTSMSSTVAETLATVNEPTGQQRASTHLAATTTKSSSSCKPRNNETRSEMENQNHRTEVPRICTCEISSLQHPPASSATAAAPSTPPSPMQQRTRTGPAAPM